ncbi:hypothetical protein C8F01DRAFT_386704 [Mycena amicta]|nr:hypothetical protein C8F01DRAFT_386704 [Mycena amicta]
MLIKLTPEVSATHTPTILFALAFPDLPQNLPLPPAWAAQLARLAADDLEAPPSQHALDRAAAMPSLLGEVLFDLPEGRVVCSFLDGKVEQWPMASVCADMLAKVILDVEESGRAERDWQRIQEERALQIQLQQREKDKEELDRRASIERQVEVKGKTKEQILNSPPASLKGTRFTKSRLVRSRSLLMALVATFAPSGSSTSSPTSPTRESLSRSPSPLQKLARRASFSTKGSAVETASPPVPIHNLETPPSSAPPSAPSSAFSKQQNETPTLVALLNQRRDELSPRMLRRRARSTLVDAFRSHVLPQLEKRVGLFESSSPSFLHDDNDEPVKKPSGGGYHAWVARSMLRRAEDRMRELEAQFPALASSPTRSRYDSESPPFSPNSISFPTSPRHATFEPWSSDDSESESEPDDDDVPSECELVGDSGSDSDGSSVHTPESTHTIGVAYVAVASGHANEASTSSTSSYFTCADDPEGDAVPPLTASHIRRPAQGHAHSRTTSNSTHPRRASSSSRKEQREHRRARRAAHAEHAAFVRMTARLRSVLVQSRAARQLAAMQKDETDRVREGRGLRRAWLDRRSGLKPGEMVQVFRPSGLGRATWGVADIVEEDPPAYEDVVNVPVQPPVATSPTTLRRPRPSPPIQRLAQLDALEVDIAELEHLEVGELDGIDIEVDLERLDLTDSLDVENMGLDVDVDDIDVFAIGAKTRTKTRRVPVRLEGWERRRTVTLERA